MVLELGLYTGAATAVTIAPVYKIKNLLIKLLNIPILGWVLNVAYGLGISYLMLTLFSFKSSMAGLANLLSTLLFTAWLYFEKKRAR